MTSLANLLVQSDKALQEKNINEFLKIINTAIDEYPLSQAGYCKLAEFFLENRQYNKADDICIKCINNIPNAVYPIILRGRIALARGKRAEAIAYWSKAQQNFPHHPDSYKALAELYIAEKDFSTAENICSQWIKNAPRAIAPMILWGDLMQHQKKFDAALLQWEKIRTQFPQSPIGYNKAIEFYIQIADYKNAELVCHQWITNIDNSTIPFLYLANISMMENDFNKALVYWQKIRSILPSFAAGYSRAAEAYCAMGRIQEAEQLCRAGMKNCPQAVEPLIVLGDCFLRQAEYEKAAPIFEQVRERFPNRPEGYSRVAEVSLAMGSIQEAEQLCRAGMKNCPQAVEPLIVLGRCFLWQGECEKAVPLFEQVRERFPNRPEGYSQAAEAYLAIGSIQEAERLCRAGMKNCPQAAEPLIVLGECFLHQNASKEALLIFEQVRQRFPSRPEGYSYAAQVYFAMGNFQEAEQLCRAGMKNCPQARTSIPFMPPNCHK